MCLGVVSPFHKLNFLTFDFRIKTNTLYRILRDDKHKHYLQPRSKVKNDTLEILFYRFSPQQNIVFMFYCRCFGCCPAEGDLYFTAKLQNYTAVEKDEVVLSCELSKAIGEVKWLKDDAEVFQSKNIQLQSDGRRRMLVFKRVERRSAGVYACDCGTDKTVADLNIEGKEPQE